jgi:hypothetical protein
MSDPWLPIIFEYLVCELAYGEQVSKHWRDILQTSRIWPTYDRIPTTYHEFKIWMIRQDKIQLRRKKGACLQLSGQDLLTSISLEKKQENKLAYTLNRHWNCAPLFNLYPLFNVSQRGTYIKFMVPITDTTFMTKIVARHGSYILLQEQIVGKYKHVLVFNHFQEEEKEDPTDATLRCSGKTKHSTGSRSEHMLQPIGEAFYTAWIKTTHLHKKTKTHKYHCKMDAEIDFCNVFYKRLEPNNDEIYYRLKRDNHKNILLFLSDLFLDMDTFGWYVKSIYKISHHNFLSLHFDPLLDYDTYINLLSSGIFSFTTGLSQCNAKGYIERSLEKSVVFAKTM